MLKLHNLSDFIFSKYGQYLAYGLIILFGLLLMSALASIYGTVTQVNNTISANATTAIKVTPAVTSSNSLGVIANAHLFGEYFTQIEQNSLPKTLLNVKLVGVMLAVPQKYSQAIVNLPGANEKILEIGDTIAGGAKIVKIMRDYIIIERDGKKEILSLPQDQLIFNNSPAALEFNNE